MIGGESQMDIGCSTVVVIYVSPSKLFQILIMTEQINPKIEKELEKATALFYKQRLREAYPILKRYFDRLPFQPERGHLKYIGMFVRTLFELGKNRELEFYRCTLEKIYQETKSPEIGYQLAYLNFDDRHENLKASKEILESIINEPGISEYKNKAKMLLAYCYDILYGDVASVRRIIDSVGSDLDEQNAHILLTWKAKVLRDEGQVEESKRVLIRFLADVSVEDDWYSHVTGRITLAYTLLKMGDVEGARREVETVRELTKGKPARSVETRLQFVEKEIDKKKVVPQVTLKEDGVESSVTLNGRTYLLSKNKKTDALLLKLLKDGYVSKASIASGLEEGPNQVYAGIHAVRRLLEKIGVSRDSISNSDGGYRFIPKVEIIREDL